MKILGFSGSLRKNSFNKKALAAAAAIVAKNGHEMEILDLKSVLLPAYDEDILEESGMPQGATIIREKIKEADLIVIASPEYNHSIPGGLKNAIDWVSVQGNPMDGKVFAIFGVSSGVYGTARMQPHLRQVLASLNAWVVPQPQILISASQISPEGTLDEKASAGLEKLLSASMDLAMSRTEKKQ